MALAERAAPGDLGGKFVRVLARPGSEVNPFADAKLAAGMHQRFPFHRFGRKLLGQQDLDPSAKKIPRRRILFRDPLCPRAAAMSEEPGGQDLRVVKDQ